MSERVGGVHRTVLEILERSTVKGIGAALGDRGNIGNAAKLRRIDHFADADLFDCVNEGNSSLIGPVSAARGPTTLMPSMERDNWDGFDPATEILP